MKANKPQAENGRAWRQALLEMIRKTIVMEKRLDLILGDDKRRPDEESEEKPDEAE